MTQETQQFKVHTSMNYQPKEGKTFTQPSQTIPDMTMSMRDIIDRHAKGMPMEIGKTPIFHEEETEQKGINYKTLDLAEVEQIAKEHKENMDKLWNQYEAEDSDKKRKILEKEIIEKHEESMQKLDENIISPEGH
jgi:uncharacterized protein YifE (UPF0438 family)